MWYNHNVDFSKPLDFFQPPPTIEIPYDADIVFVSDMFVDQYQGGAELTTEALIQYPWA